MKIVASGSFLMAEGEVFELPVGPGVVRFGQIGSMSPAGENELIINVPDNILDQLIVPPSFTWQVGGHRIRNRVGFAKVLGGAILVHYTFFTE